MATNTEIKLLSQRMDQVEKGLGVLVEKMDDLSEQIGATREQSAATAKGVEIMAAHTQTLLKGQAEKAKLRGQLMGRALGIVEGLAQPTTLIPTLRWMVALVLAIGAMAGAVSWTDAIGYLRREATQAWEIAAPSANGATDAPTDATAAAPTDATEEAFPTSLPEAGP